MKVMVVGSLRGHFALFYEKTASGRFSGGFWKFLFETFPTCRGDEALAISEGGVKPVFRSFLQLRWKDRPVDRLFTKESNGVSSPRADIASLTPYQDDCSS
jgi:hypothetical protein